MASSAPCPHAPWTISRGRLERSRTCSELQNQDPQRGVSKSGDPTEPAGPDASPTDTASARPCGRSGRTRPSSPALPAPSPLCPRRLSSRQHVLSASLRPLLFHAPRHCSTHLQRHPGTQPTVRAAPQLQTAALHSNPSRCCGLPSHTHPPRLPAVCSCTVCALQKGTWKTFWGDGEIL